jgi:hypothetical protein
LIELGKIGGVKCLEQECARVVHQDVGRTPISQDSGAGPNDFRWLSQIAGHVPEAIAGAVLETPCQPYDSGALGGKRLRCGETDPA